MKLCEKYKLSLSEQEIASPALIHARLGAYLAEKEYQITDSQILSAIRCHTTGQPDMSMLEKIVYLADYIEPGRKMIPSLPEVRRLAFCDIDQAVALCAEATISHLKKQKRPIDPMTIRTYEFYAKIKRDL